MGPIVLEGVGNSSTFEESSWAVRYMVPVAVIAGMIIAIIAIGCVCYRRWQNTTVIIASRSSSKVKAAARSQSSSSDEEEEGSSDEEDQIESQKKSV